jgi:cell fate regulator YaaT (PSP1 superfamily)
MKRLTLIVFLLITFSPIGIAKEEVPVTSTQGVEDFDGAAVEKAQISIQEKNEQKEKINRSKDIVKLKNKTKKLEQKKKQQEREQEYLEYRLELKKQKLEMFNSDTVKGEE